MPTGSLAAEPAALRGHGSMREGMNTSVHQVLRTQHGHDIPVTH
jgi:hypothetical protein